jgi:hypothetical protein
MPVAPRSASLPGNRSVTGTRAIVVPPISTSASIVPTTTRTRTTSAANRTQNGSSTGIGRTAATTSVPEPAHRPQPIRDRPHAHRWTRCSRRAEGRAPRRHEAPDGSSPADRPQSGCRSAAHAGERDSPRCRRTDVTFMVSGGTPIQPSCRRGRSTEKVSNWAGGDLSTTVSPPKRSPWIRDSPR